MDPVSGTASVLTLLGLALGTAKFIHQVISSIKNGPLPLQTFIREVETLQKILEQFLAYQGQAPSSGVELEIVTDLVNACHDDLRRFKTEIKKAQYSTGTKAEIMWKRIRSTIRNKDVQRMEQDIHRHATKLGHQLNSLQHKSSNDQLTRIRDSLKVQTECQEKVLLLLQKQEPCLSATIDKGVNAGRSDPIIPVASTTVGESIYEAGTTLQHKVESIPKMTSKQFTELGEGLSELRAQVEILKSLQTMSLRNFDDGCKKKNGTEDLGPDSEVLESISRLCQLAQHHAITLRDVEAQDIIDDIETMIDSISTHISPSRRVPSQKRPLSMVEDSAIDYREIKRIKGLLSSSPFIDINQINNSVASTKNKRFVKGRRIEEVKTPYGKFLVTLTRRQLLLSLSTPSERTSIGQQSTELVTTIKTMPEKSKLQATIAVYVHQRMFLNGHQSICPSISVGITLPVEHEVFKMMRTGDLAGFQRLLDQGKASLRSYDEKGVPLLHYALPSPSMCRFLLNHGADVNEVACNIYNDPYYERNDCSPLEIILDEQNSYGDDYITYNFNRQECRRLFLDCADPTRVALQRAIERNDVASTQSLLHNAGSLGFLELGDECGCPPLFDALGPGCLSILELLIKRGANIHARDNRGLSCLHVIWFKHLLDPYPALPVLFLLLHRGADVDAIDNNGKSVTEYAYGGSNFFDACKGDLWDRALVAYGHNLFDKRKGHPRIPRYNRKYSRYDFENLWHGRESDCPYYDDPPQWPPVEDLENFEADSEDEIEDNELSSLLSISSRHAEENDEVRSGGDLECPSSDLTTGTHERLEYSPSLPLDSASTESTNPHEALNVDSVHPCHDTLAPIVSNPWLDESTTNTSDLWSTDRTAGSPEQAMFSTSIDVRNVEMDSHMPWDEPNPWLEAEVEAEADA